MAAVTSCLSFFGLQENENAMRLLPALQMVLGLVRKMEM